MLTISALCADGERLSLPTAVYIELCRDEDVPADSLRIVFPQRIEEELAEIYITDDGDEIFCGPVDEQTFLSYNTEKTEVVARSMAAVLLDNEACPHNFVNLCTAVLFDRYIAPCGMADFVGKDRVLKGKFDVTNGTSCWQVAEAFGKRVFGKKPVIQGKTMVFSDSGEKARIFFSNEGEGIPFTGFEHSKLRCKLISKVRAKTEDFGTYTTVVENPAAVNSAVMRERYLDASSLSGETLSKAFEAVRRSLQSFEVITLKCPAQLAGILGAEARIKGNYGIYEDLRVRSLRYVMDNSTEYTRVTLCRKEN